MAIEFRCPQGHKLSCPDDLAGRSAKCPKCGAMVRIPSPGESAHAPSDSAASHPDLHAVAAHESSEHAAGGSGTRQLGGDPSGVGSAVAEGSGVGRDSSLGGGSSPDASHPGGTSPSATSANDSGVQRANPAEVHDPTHDTPAKGSMSKEPTIVFLCPNGHKLNCPASLQGRPGKCPHCGAKFIIPKEDEGDDDDDVGEAEIFTEMLGAADQRTAAAGPGESAATVMPPPLGNVSDTADGGELPFDFADLVPADGAQPAANGAAMAQLVARLWQQKGEHGVVEIHLRGGEKVVPDWFSTRFSQESCGIFAVQDKDGRYTLTAVNWDAVERIALRGVDELPEGMFE